MTAQTTPSTAAALRLRGAAACSRSRSRCLPAATTRASDDRRAIPNDYRQRHPIALKEGRRTVEVFVGTGRGGLTPRSAPRSLALRADLAARGDRRHHHRRAGRHAERSAPPQDAAREIRSILAAAGVPPHAIEIRPYQPDDPARLAHHPAQLSEDDGGGRPVRPVAGRSRPDLRPGATIENRPYWNLGCATQRNLAAMVDNPADLVQPRAETPVYTARRTTGARQIPQGRADRDALSRMPTKARSATSANDQVTHSKPAS